MKTNEIKKDMKIKSVQLGVPVSGVMADSHKGDRRMVHVKGTEVGLFDETGSVYSHDIVLCEVNGEWIRIEHTDKQLKLKKQVEDYFG
jgi:hypothetical protein